MSTDLYSKRLEDLFSGASSVTPDPVPETVAAPAPSSQAGPEAGHRSNGHGQHAPTNGQVAAADELELNALHARVAELEAALEALQAAPANELELNTLRARVAELETALETARAAAASPTPTKPTGTQRLSAGSIRGDKLQVTEEVYLDAITAAGAVPYSRLYSAKEVYAFMGEGIVRLTGYTAEEMTPQLLDSIILEVITRGTVAGLAHAEAIQQTRAGKNPNWLADYRIRARNGQTRWISDSSVEIVGEDNKPIGSIGILIDITDRKRAEEALRESEERYRSFIENTSDLVQSVDAEGRLLFVNRTWLETLGYTEEELGTLNVFDVIHPESLAHCQPLFARVMAGEKIERFEATFVKKNGQVVDLEGTSTPRFADGRVVASQTTLHDVTERKRAEAELRASQERYALAVDGSNDGLWDWDIVSSEVYFSPRWKKQLGFEDHELANQFTSFEERLHPDDRDWVLTAINDYLNGRRDSYAMEFRLRHKDGSYRWILARGKGLIDVDGRPYRIAGSHTDITERKQAEEALARRAAELESLNAIGQILAAQRDLSSMLKQAGDKICEVFGVNTGYIALYDSRSNRVEMPYYMDNGQYLSIPTREMGGGLTSAVIRSRRPLRFDSLTREHAAELGAFTTGSDNRPQSWLGVPILEGERVIGVVNVQHQQASRFSDSDARLLTTMAASIGAAIQNARLLEQTQQRAAELTTLNRIMATAASSLDLQTILKNTSREIVEVVNARNCGIAVLDASREHLTVIADYNAHPDDPSAEGVVIPVANNPSSLQVISTKRSLSLADAQTDPLTEPIHDLMRARQTFALMLVPLVTRGEVVGTIGVDRDKPGRQFTPTEVALVETIAAQLAGAIDNIRLFESAQRRAKELETVAEVSATIATIHDPQVMLNNVVELTKARFDLYHAHIYLLNEVGDTLVLAAGAGEAGHQMLAQGWRIPLHREQSLVARAARTRQGVISNDVREDPNFLPNLWLPTTRSEMAVPILVEGEVLGVLDVQSEKPGNFSEDDVRIQSTLAAQIGVALQNDRHYQQMQKALAELNTLTRRLAREGWQTHLARSAAKEEAYLYDLTQLRAVEPGAGTTGPLGQLTVPLRVQGEAIGTLAIAEPELPPEDAQEVVAAVAERLSAHLENLRLNEEMQENLARQQRLSAELETVAQVSAAASTLLERDLLLQQVVNLTRERFSLYHAQVYLYDEVGETLNLVAASGEVGRKMAAEGRIIPIALEQSVVATAARTRQPIIVSDTQASSSFLPHPLLPETRAEMSVPMVAGDKLVGVLDVQSHQPHRFTDEDVRIKSTLASQVAIALQNADLYAEQTATVARLQELDQLKSSFLANMSHELRTPLNSILGFTDVILEGLDGPLTDRMENDLMVVQKNGQHLLDLINDILDMAKIEAGRMTLNPEHFNLREVVDEVLEITGSLAREKKLYLQADLPPYEDLDLDADHVRVRQVLINLVGNACKFTEKGGITIRAERQGENILLCVSDTGIGIPPEKLETVFEAFSQIDTSTTRKAGGTGLGLPISRHLIELHGGRLWAESRGIPGEGSKFYIELPVVFRQPLLAE